MITSNDPATPAISFPVNGEGVAPIPVVPDVKLNGSDGPVSVDIGAPVTVSISLTAGDYAGQSAELWLGLQTPFGRYWFVEGSGWAPSATPIAFRTGVIGDLQVSIEMGSNLPAGAYDFEFTADNIINGSLDRVWSDSADLINFPIWP